MIWKWCLSEIHVSTNAQFPCHTYHNEYSSDMMNGMLTASDWWKLLFVLVRDYWCPQLYFKSLYHFWTTKGEVRDIGTCLYRNKTISSHVIWNPKVINVYHIVLMLPLPPTSWLICVFIFSLCCMVSNHIYIDAL